MVHGGSVTVEVSSKTGPRQPNFSLYQCSAQGKAAARLKPVRLQSGKFGAIQKQIVDNSRPHNWYRFELAVLQSDIAGYATPLEVEDAGDPGAGDPDSLLMGAIVVVAAQDQKAQEFGTDRTRSITGFRPRAVT